MSTVRSALAQKSGALIHVRSGDMVVEALRQMRDNRGRSVLVIDDGVLVGIVTQGDCAIKVLLPGFDAKQMPVSQVNDARPGDGQAGPSAGRLHGDDGSAQLSPSARIGRGLGRGRDLDRRRRQEHHPGSGAQRGRPDGLHHERRSRGLTNEPRYRHPHVGVLLTRSAHPSIADGRFTRLRRIAFLVMNYLCV
ncbi:CBS domain-containing protein [Bradyrhizobium oligotrophicum]|uniref:CBS domain-containing protein n=1 Tax=Bradyrhizobium TaxID=374 RepID=UPI0029165E37|nr:CBS domain-containing protein [Bradyrhizobium sp. SZCCHNS3052]